MITDPNQSVCVTDNTKTMEDLANRTDLQTKIWDCVLNLRQGRYYSDCSNGFLTAIEKCQSSIFDAPDLLHTHDEGTILRRILNAFSLRPTYVSITSLTGLPPAVSTINLPAASFTHITTVPMLNVRLPHTPRVGLAAQQSIGLASVNLNDALHQPQWYIEGKTLVPKSQTIVHSRDVVFFYVDRRFKSVNYASVNQPYMFLGLPPTVSGLDSINETPVHFNKNMILGNDNFGLRSVVFVEVTNLGETKGGNVITGCSTGVVIKEDPAKARPEIFFLYDPQGAAFYHTDVAGNYVTYRPISQLYEHSGTPQGERSFNTLAVRRGTIFVYVKTP